MSKFTLRLLCIHGSKYLNFIKFLHDNNSKGQDTLDAFTSKLIQEKSEKWETARNKKNKMHIYTNVNSPDISLEEVEILKSANVQNVDSIFLNAIENNDIRRLKNLIEKAISLDIVPSFKTSEKIMSFCSQNVITESIFIFDKFASEKYPEEYLRNSHFKHYFAEYFWLRGNVKKSLDLFEEVFFTNAFLRKKVKFILKCLIINIVHESSEATLVAILNFAKKIAESYSDFYLMAFIWQNCFLSEWFADQCTADALLQEYEKLQSAIDERLPYILNYAIKQNKPEILYRLMELLLTYKKTDWYEKVLQMLFNYKYRSKDLRSCAEIVQWSLKLNVPLTTFQHEQFLSLLLENKLGTPSKEENAKSTQQKEPPNFKLKF